MRCLPRSATDFSNETGFLVIDQNLKVISINTEALRILVYPDLPTEKDSVDRIPEKIRLLTEAHIPRDAFFMVGRREYFSRVLPITLYSSESVQVTAILLERRVSCALS